MCYSCSGYTTAIQPVAMCAQRRKATTLKVQQLANVLYAYTHKSSEINDQLTLLMLMRNN